MERREKGDGWWEGAEPVTGEDWDVDWKKDASESWYFNMSADRKDDKKKRTSCADLMGGTGDNKTCVDSSDKVELDMWTTVWL